MLVALSVTDVFVQIVGGMAASETPAVRAGLMTIGMEELVALADVLVTQPVRPVTFNVNTSPGLNVVGAFTSVLIGNTIWLPDPTGVPLNNQLYELPLRDEVNVAVSPEQKFNLFIWMARLGVVADTTFAVNVLVATVGLATQPPVARMLQYTLVPFTRGLKV